MKLVKEFTVYNNYYHDNFENNIFTYDYIMKKSLYLFPLLFILTGCSNTTPQPALPEQPQPIIQTGSIIEESTDPLEDNKPTTTPFTRRSDNSILDQITLPEGFEIDLFAEVDNARSMEVVETDDMRFVFV
jgi:hypothetical protein